MPDPKLLAIITALSFVSVTNGASGQDSLAKLQELEQLIVRKDCGGMRNFIGANPDLTRGNDPLAVELRSYANKLDNGLINCFAASASDTGPQREVDGRGVLSQEAIY